MTDIDRRQFLKFTLTGALAGTGLCGCDGDSSRNPVDESAGVTTLDYSVEGPPQIVQHYTRLQRGPAEPLVTLSLPDAVPQASRAARRVALASFAHFSDLHIIDVGSPGRLPFLRQYEWAISPENASGNPEFQFLPNTAQG